MNLGGIISQGDVESKILATNDRALILLAQFLENPVIEETDSTIKENIHELYSELLKLDFKRLDLEDQIRELEYQSKELEKEIRYEGKRLKMLYGS